MYVIPSSRPKSVYADYLVLLSSHRDYESEKDWELLRNDSPYSDALRFEETREAGPSGSKRYEMVVTTDWASLVRHILRIYDHLG